MAVLEDLGVVLVKLVKAVATAAVVPGAIEKQKEKHSWRLDLWAAHCQPEVCVNPVRIVDGSAAVRNAPQGMTAGSLKLLQLLNGGEKGRLAEWLSSRHNEPRIAWYPSAGEDFRWLLYLHKDYRKVHPSLDEEPVPPDIFIHTDYFPWNDSNFLDRPLHYSDQHTSITIAHIEELPRLDLPVHDDLVDSPPGSATNRVMYLEIAINSQRLGRYTQPLIYAFAENSAFCSEYLVRPKATVSHIMQVRYGNSLGGGLSSPGWIRHQFGILNTEVGITDGGIGGDDSTNNLVFEHFPNLRNPESPPATWRPLRTTEYGTPPFITQLQWYLVKNRRTAQ